MRSAPTTRVYTRAALEAEGFSARTIRFYVAIGVLPPANGRGRGAYYTDEHIAVLREINRRRDARCSLLDVAEWRRTRHRAA